MTDGPAVVDVSGGTLRIDRGIAWARLGGRLDHVFVSQLSARIDHLAADRRPRCLVLDLGRIETIGAAELDVLAELHRACHGSGTTLRIIPSRVVREAPRTPAR